MEKLLIMSNFYFWHNVFKDVFFANASNPSVCGNGFNSVRNPYQSDYLSIDLPVNQVIIAPIHSTNDLFYNGTLTASTIVLQNERRFRQIKSEN